MSSSWSLSLTSQVPQRVVRLASVLSCPARLQNQLPSLLRASSAAPVAFESVGRHVSTNSSRKPTNTDWFSRATSSLALNYRFPMPSPHITRPVPLPNGSSEWELSKLAAAKLTGAGVLIVERSTAPIHTSAPLPSSASPSPSSSSSSSLLSSGNLVLFRRSGFDTWEEPGGCLKPEDEPLACAARELFEESCGTVSGETLSRHLLPRHLDVFGRSTASRYRTYFLDVPQGVLPTHALYETHREQMVEQSALKEFLETDGIIRVPLANVVECLPLHISTPPSSSGYVEVKDSEGVPRKISARTIKVLQQGGLIQLLGSLSML